MTYIPPKFLTYSRACIKCGLCIPWLTKTKYICWRTARSSTSRWICAATCCMVNPPGNLKSLALFIFPYKWNKASSLLHICSLTESNAKSPKRSSMLSVFHPRNRPARKATRMAKGRTKPILNIYSVINCAREFSIKIKKAELLLFFYSCTYRHRSYLSNGLVSRFLLTGAKPLLYLVRATDINQSFREGKLKGREALFGRLGVKEQIYLYLVFFLSRIDICFTLAAT